MGGGMSAKKRAELLLSLHGPGAIDILLCAIEAAVSARNDALAMELDSVLQEVERRVETRRGNSPFSPPAAPAIH